MIVDILKKNIIYVEETKMKLNDGCRSGFFSGFGNSFLPSPFKYLLGMMRTEICDKNNPKLIKTNLEHILDILNTFNSTDKLKTLDNLDKKNEIMEGNAGGRKVYESDTFISRFATLIANIDACIKNLEVTKEQRQLVQAITQRLIDARKSSGTYRLPGKVDRFTGFKCESTPYCGCTSSIGYFLRGSKAFDDTFFTCDTRSNDYISTDKDKRELHGEMLITFLRNGINPLKSLPEYAKKEIVELLQNRHDMESSELKTILEQLHQEKTDSEEFRGRVDVHLNTTCAWELSAKILHEDIYTIEQKVSKENPFTSIKQELKKLRDEL